MFNILSIPEASPKGGCMNNVILIEYVILTVHYPYVFKITKVLSEGGVGLEKASPVMLMVSGYIEYPFKPFTQLPEERGIVFRSGNSLTDIPRQQKGLFLVVIGFVKNGVGIVIPKFNRVLSVIPRLKV
jgi:hypothetical protein